uniref:Uncharacterized protein n=1 Tax=Phlegmariurus squarrosus TaxID=73615 RepID=H9M883_PHLSQ|nr:hypothetical protein HusqMp108 [Phlegmariurus squarrosus]AEV55790.1 hypothetical protein HusqMp108 [Phlegmariurus squarrosus]
METVMLSREWCIRSVTSTAGLRARKQSHRIGVLHIYAEWQTGQSKVRKKIYRTISNHHPAHGVAPAKLGRDHSYQDMDGRSQKLSEHLADEDLSHRLLGGGVHLVKRVQR